MKCIAPAISLLLLAGLNACPYVPPEDGTATGYVGRGFPLGSLQRCDGTDLDLGRYVEEQDVVYLTFAAGWCVACHEEIPLINERAVAAFAADPEVKVGVLQIMIEDSEGNAPTQALCSGWTQSYHPDFEVVYDADQGYVASIFSGSVTRLPYHFVLTHDGVVRFDLLDTLPADLTDIITTWLPKDG
jgi:hypothetical protein